MLVLTSSTCPAATLVTSSVDGGGQRTTSASYTMDGSVGGIGGIGSAGSRIARHGYPGQLSEATGLLVTGTPVQVNETSTSQLSGTATLDDATVTALAGSDINWSAPSFPIASINSNGLAAAAAVYTNTSGAFTGNYLGASNVGSLLVLDSNPDNYGFYASDSVPDSWQIQYFGLENPNAAPAVDPDGDSQNNLFEYTAGLDPTNSASLFVLRIENVGGQPDQKNLIFQPWASGRTYTTECRTDLVTGSYTNLTGYGGPQTNSTEVSITDLNAIEQQKFYRIKISHP